MTMEYQLDELSSQQGLVVTSAGTIVVLGVAGSGKSTALQARADRLSQDAHVVLKCLIPEPATLAGTDPVGGEACALLWQEFALRYLSTTSLGFLGKKPSVATIGLQLGILDEIRRKHRISVPTDLIYRGIRKAKLDGATLANGFENLRRFRNCLGAEADPHAILSVAQEYERTLRRGNLIDAEDPVLLVGMLLDAGIVFPEPGIDHLIADDIFNAGWGASRIFRHAARTARSAALSADPFTSPLSGHRQLGPMLSLLRESGARIIRLGSSYETSSGNLHRAGLRLKNHWPAAPYVAGTNRLAPEDVRLQRHKETVEFLTALNSIVSESSGKVLITGRHAFTLKLVSRALMGNGVSIRSVETGGLSTSIAARLVSAADALVRRPHSAEPFLFLQTLWPSKPFSEASASAAKTGLPVSEALIKLDPEGFCISILESFSDLASVGPAAIPTFLIAHPPEITLSLEDKHWAEALPRWLGQAPFSSEETIDGVRALLAGAWDYLVETPCTWVAPLSDLTSGYWDEIHVVGASEGLLPLSGCNDDEESAYLARIFLRSRGSIWFHHIQQMVLDERGIETKMRPSLALSDFGFPLPEYAGPSGPAEGKSPTMKMSM